LNEDGRTKKLIHLEVHMEPRVLLIIEKLRARIAHKYTIRDLRVFGSWVRGDSRTGSDIDVLVCLSELDRTIEEDLFNMAYDLELEYDCLIDLIAISERDLKGRIGAAPIYEMILSEGVMV
jgi:predicted nucleotidyltransferase